MVEVIVSIALSLVVIVAITELNLQTIKISQQSMIELRASMYLTEGIEVGKDLELSDAGWDKIINTTCISSSLVCHPSIASGVWTLVPAPIPDTVKVDGSIFTQSVWVESVNRTNLCAFPNEIASSGCLDPKTKKFVSRVTWTDNQGLHSMQLETYLYHF